jgi:hypothetical protein
MKQIQKSIWGGREKKKRKKERKKVSPEMK